MTTPPKHTNDDLGIQQAAQAPGKAIGALIASHQQGKQAIQIVRELVFTVAILFCSVYSFFAEVVLHRTHGLRSITLARFVLALLALHVTVGIPPLLTKSTPAFSLAGSGLLMLVSVALFVMSLRHARRACKRFKNGERVYSKSSGDPYRLWYRLPWIESPWEVMRWAEPLALMLAGGLMFAVFGSWIGVYLGIAGLALMLKHALTQKQIHLRLLDAIDAEIEASEITTALKQGRNKPHAETNFVVPIVIPQASQHRSIKSRH